MLEPLGRASARFGLSRATAVIAVGCALMIGCDDTEESASTPSGNLARALEELGGGGEGTIGISWVDPQLVRELGGDAALMAEALGPNAGSVVDAAARLQARFGLDPLAASRMVSIGGSYSFGLRLEGVDGRRLASRLLAEGGRRRGSGDYARIEIGEYGVVPDALRDVGVRGLGAFDALGPRLAAMAMSDRALASLLGESERLLDEALYRAAVRCLGGVAAARVVPDKLLVSTELGGELVAVGIEAEREVLCTAGGTPERAAEVANAFRTGLDPGSHDPITDEPIDRSVAAVEVEANEYEGIQTVRAELTLQPAEARGYVFGALERASVVGWINGAPSTFQRTSRHDSRDASAGHPPLLRERLTSSAVESLVSSP